MSNQTKVLLRMKDVAFALAASESYGYNLNRINLQKFVYLLDIVGYIYELFPPQNAYVTYKNGPYDKDVQNAVDTLVFRDLARTIEVKRNPDSKINATYGLTDFGREWVGSLINIEDFKIRHQAASDVASQIDKIGWAKIVQLVYAEPTFLSKRPKGFGQTIDITNGLDNTASNILQIIENGLKINSKDDEIAPEFIVDIFFRFLQKQMERQEKEQI